MLLVHVSRPKSIRGLNEITKKSCFLKTFATHFPELRDSLLGHDPQFGKRWCNGSLHTQVRQYYIYALISLSLQSRTIFIFNRFLFCLILVPNVHIEISILLLPIFKGGSTVKQDQQATRLTLCDSLPASSAQIVSSSIHRPTSLDTRIKQIQRHAFSLLLQQLQLQFHV